MSDARGVNEAFGARSGLKPRHRQAGAWRGSHQMVRGWEHPGRPSSCGEASQALLRGPAGEAPRGRVAQDGQVCRRSAPAGNGSGPGTRTGQRLHPTRTGLGPAGSGRPSPNCGQGHRARTRQALGLWLRNGHSAQTGERNVPPGRAGRARRPRRRRPCAATPFGEPSSPQEASPSASCVRLPKDAGGRSHDGQLPAQDTAPAAPASAVQGHCRGGGDGCRPVCTGSALGAAAWPPVLVLAAVCLGPAGRRGVWVCATCPASQVESTRTEPI